MHRARLLLACAVAGSACTRSGSAEPADDKAQLIQVRVVANLPDGDRWVLEDVHHDDDDGLVGGFHDRGDENHDLWVTAFEGPADTPLINICRSEDEFEQCEFEVRPDGSR